MKNLDLIAEELFNKIRGRFPSITIGNEEGKVTNEPKTARFYDFDYNEGDKKLGRISVSLTDDAVEVMYSNNFAANEDTLTRNNWFNFLKELRGFAKKRLLKFDTRNINKSNLDKRDYKFLAKNRIGDETMTESKMYGTSKTSYQNVGEARIAIKHTQPVNMESVTGRIQNIGTIYIESADGERFMYPYKHLNGARAMARHVAEGGKPYDDFGKHITGLSEELSSLKKFKSYVNRSSVMAEGLSGYVDVVNERVEEIKKTIFNLQKESRYKEVYDSFEVPVFEDVPDDVAENWIDQLTIRQFNEELKDVFPYVYRLIGEATRAKSLSVSDLLPESEDTLPRQHAPYYVEIKNGQPHIKVDATNTVVVEPSSKWTEITPDVEQRARRQGFRRMPVEFNGKMYDVLMSGTRAFAAPSTVQQMVNSASPESKIEAAFEEAMGQFAESEVVSEDLGSFKSAGIPDEYSKNLLRTVNIENDVQIDAIDGLPKAKDFDSGIVINVLPNGDVVSMLKTKSRMEGGDVYFRLAYTNGEFERELKPNVKSATQGMSKRGKFYRIDKRWWDYSSRNTKPSTDADDVKSRTTADPLGGSDYDIYSYMNDTFMPKMKQKMEAMIDDIYTNLRKLDKDKTQYGSRLDNVQRNQREVALQAANAIEKIVEDGFTRSTMEEFLRLGGKLHRGWGSIPNNERELRDLLKSDTMSRAKWAKTILDTAKQYHNIVMDMVNRSAESIDAAKDDQLPLSEFILSMYDRETGQFPKGETAVLTAVEKDYGESYIEPAKQFIEAVNVKFEEVNGYKDTELDENPMGGLQQQLQSKGVDPNNPHEILKKSYGGIFKKLEQDLMPQIQAALKSGNPQDVQLAKKWMDLFNTAKNQVNELDRFRSLAGLETSTFEEAGQYIWNEVGDDQDKKHIDMLANWIVKKYKTWGAEEARDDDILDTIDELVRKYMPEVGKIRNVAVIGQEFIDKFPLKKPEPEYDDDGEEIENQDYEKAIDGFINAFWGMVKTAHNAEKGNTDSYGYKVNARQNAESFESDIKRLAGLNESLVLENNTDDMKRDVALIGEVQRTVFSIVKQMSNEDKKKHPEYQKVFQNELKKIQDDAKRQNKPGNPQADQQAAEKKALGKIHFKIESQIRDIVTPSIRAKYYGK